jgi:hypothetical protein
VALPSFTVTGGVFHLLGDVVVAGLVDAFYDTTVVFTHNIPGQTMVVWEGAIYEIKPVRAKVLSDGSLKIGPTNAPVKLLANDPGLSVTGIQWTAHIPIGERTVECVFNAPSDNASVDLANVLPSATPVIAQGVPALTELTLEALLNDDTSDLRVLMDGLFGGGGGGGGAAAWSSITGKPAVIAAGSDAATARAVIGALDSTAVSALITTAVNGILNGAPGALDTLKELADAINDDASFAATVTTALNARALTSTTVSAGTGLTGGGSLAANRTLALSAGSIASLAKADSAIQSVNSTNVDAAGAVMNSDTSTASMNFVSASVDTSSTQVPSSLAVRSAITLGKDVPVALGPSMSRYGIIPIPYTATHRVPSYIPVACTNLRLVYTNWKVTTFGNADGDKTTPADMPIKVSIEVAGVIYPVTFNGNINPTISPLGQVISDPIAVDIAAGTWLYTRTYTNSISYYGNRISSSVGSGGYAFGDFTDAGSGTIPDQAGSLIGPSVILGTPQTRTPYPTVYGVGDSLMDGFGDGVNYHPYNDTYDKAGRGGFLLRAAKNVGFGCIDVAVGGEHAGLGGGAGGWNVAGFHARRLGFSKYCRTAVVDLGNNDIYTDLNLATTQASVIKLWNQLNDMGLRMFATNNTPRCLVSTDGYLTTANQTITTGNTQRLAFNAWLRDGAPIVSGAAAAVGTSGAARCNYFDGNTVVTPASGPTHPLYGTVELADAVESARDSGKWRLPYSSRSVADGVTTASSQTITSATANFTNADIGKFITVAGAAAGSTLFGSLIAYVNSTTSVIVDSGSVPALSVSGAALKVIDHATNDGAHPGPLAAEDMAARLPTNYFI